MEFSLQNLFINILNMSITATYVIIFVLLARIPLKKAPRVFSYSLWSVVLFRLVCPYTFSTGFSLLKSISFLSSKTEPIPANLGLMEQPSVDIGIESVNNVINSSLPAATPYYSANLMQIAIAFYSTVWIIGAFIVLLYSIASYIILKKKIDTAIFVNDNIFECENIQTPFVLGIFKPKIFLPAGLSDNEIAYILKHEQTHISRLDYLAKPFAFLVLCIHWFNPLVWLSFIMMSRDMEMSCDEKVIKELGNSIKREYSTSLLSMAVNRGFIAGSPLAFGECDVKKRIKNVLNYKKPSFWVVVSAAVIVIVIGVGLISDPEIEKSGSEQKLLSYLSTRSEYVGNASKVGGVINLMAFPSIVSYDHFELQTGSKPYGVTIYLKTDAGRLDDAMVSDYILYQRNSLVLFSLVGNADEIIYNLSDGIKSNTIQFSRNWANNAMDVDVWKTSESQTTYSEFLKKLDSKFPMNADVPDKTVINTAIVVEDSLNIIMSSPQSSSNPNEYINSHRNEFTAIPDFNPKEHMRVRLFH